MSSNDQWRDEAKIVADTQIEEQKQAQQRKKEEEIRRKQERVEQAAAAERIRNLAGEGRDGMAARKILGSLSYPETLVVSACVPTPNNRKGQTSFYYGPKGFSSFRDAPDEKLQPIRPEQLLAEVPSDQYAAIVGRIEKRVNSVVTRRAKKRDQSS